MREILIVITILEVVAFILLFIAIFSQEHRGKLVSAGLAIWILSHIVGAVWKHFLF